MSVSITSFPTHYSRTVVKKTLPTTNIYKASLYAFKPRIHHLTFKTCFSLIVLFVNLMVYSHLTTCPNWTFSRKFLDHRALGLYLYLFRLPSITCWVPYLYLFWSADRELGTLRCGSSWYYNFISIVLSTPCPRIALPGRRTSNCDSKCFGLS